VALISIEEKEELQVIDRNIREHVQALNLNLGKNIYPKYKIKGFID
jgi:hypothetical protein